METGRPLAESTRQKIAERMLLVSSTSSSSDSEDSDYEVQEGPVDAGPSASAKSQSHSLQDLVLSCSSIQRLRQHYRAMISARLKDEFQADAALVVHWD